MVNPFPDLSNYQAGSNVAAILAALGSDRALFKATEGTSYKASTFPVFVAATIALGKKVGGYHFARPSSSSGVDEAAWHSSVLRINGFSPNNRDTHWSCYDFEDPALDQKVVANKAVARSHAINFTQTMANLGWTTGVVYGSYPYFNWCGLTAAMLPSGWRNLHIANYGQTPDALVTLPSGWSRSQVVARQYTSTATVPGASTQIDLSHFDREWLGMGESPMSGEADAAIVALNGAIAGVNPSDFVHQFIAAYWKINTLVADPNLGAATKQQAGAIGLNVSNVRDDIGALRADLDNFVQALQAAGFAPLDYDLLAGKVVDALAARLTASTHVVTAVRSDTPIFDQMPPPVPPPSERRPAVSCERDARVCPNPVEVPRLDGQPSDWVCGCPSSEE